MAKASITEKVPVSLNKFFDLIVDYEKYPQFVTACSKVELKRLSDTQSEVTYHVSMMKDISYKLLQNEDRANGKMSWSLISSDAVKSNNGQWTLRKVDESTTEVTYDIDIEFNIPVPGFILSGLVKSSLPSMIKNFVEQSKKV